ncbi:hypothetical protein [Streptomyces sp. NBC_00306]|uniref:hypothetical protein n=1 Tax=Streptomyces sp. NBC_00306 TaxID=2975708 RepID=UPI002E296B0B|nr:hypothetical protein [Streptomyces sp. NBC_00306]
MTDLAQLQSRVTAVLTDAGFTLTDRTTEGLTVLPTSDGVTVSWKPDDQLRAANTGLRKALRIALTTILNTAGLQLTDMPTDPDGILVTGAAGSTRR